MASKGTSDDYGSDSFNSDGYSLPGDRDDESELEPVRDDDGGARGGAETKHDSDTTQDITEDNSQVDNVKQFQIQRVQVANASAAKVSTPPRAQSPSAEDATAALAVESIVKQQQPIPKAVIGASGAPANALARPMSPAQLRGQLLKSLQSSGVLGSIKSQLRAQLLGELNSSIKPGILQQSAQLQRGSARRALTASENIANAMIAEYLAATGYKYTLKVFGPESGTASTHASLQPSLNLLRSLASKTTQKAQKGLHNSAKMPPNINKAGSQGKENTADEANQPAIFTATGGSQQPPLLSQCVAFLFDRAASPASPAAAPAAASAPAKQQRKGLGSGAEGLKAKLQAVDKRFDQRRLSSKGSGGRGAAGVTAAEREAMGQWRAEVQRQCKEEMREELMRLRANELAEVRRGERERFRGELEKLRGELEARQRERMGLAGKVAEEEAGRVRAKERALHAQFYAQRQQILGELERVRAREGELGRAGELERRGLDMDREKVAEQSKVLSAKMAALDALHGQVEAAVAQQLARQAGKLKAEAARVAEGHAQEMAKVQAQLTHLTALTQSLAKERDRLQGAESQLATQSVEWRTQLNTLQSQVEDLSKRLRHKALLVHELQGELVTRASHEKEVLAARGVLQQVKDNCAEAVRLAHVDAERSASHALATAQSDAERTRGKMEASLARAHRLLLQKTEAEEAVRQEKEEAELRLASKTRDLASVRQQLEEARQGMLLNSHDDVWSPKVSLGDIESAALGKEGQEASSQGAEKKGKEAEADEQNQKTTATATTASFQVTLSEDVAPSSSSSSLSFSPAHPSSAAPSVARWTQPAADWEKDMSDHMDTFKKLEAQMLALEDHRHQRHASRLPFRATARPQQRRRTPSFLSATPAPAAATAFASAPLLAWPAAAPIASPAVAARGANLAATAPSAQQLESMRQQVATQRSHMERQLKQMEAQEQVACQAVERAAAEERERQRLEQLEQLEQAKPALLSQKQQMEGVQQAATAAPALVASPGLMDASPAVSAPPETAPEAAAAAVATGGQETTQLTASPAASAATPPTVAAATTFEQPATEEAKAAEKKAKAELRVKEEKEIKEREEKEIKEREEKERKEREEKERKEREEKERKEREEKERKEREEKERKEREEKEVEDKKAREKRDREAKEKKEKEAEVQRRIEARRAEQRRLKQKAQEDRERREREEREAFERAQGGLGGGLRSTGLAREVMSEADREIAERKERLRRERVEEERREVAREKREAEDKRKKAAAEEEEKRQRQVAEQGKQQEETEKVGDGKGEAEKNNDFLAKYKERKRQEKEAAAKAKKEAANNSGLSFEKEFDMAGQAKAVDDTGSIDFGEEFEIVDDDSSDLLDFSRD